MMWGFIGLKDCGKFPKTPELDVISRRDTLFYEGKRIPPGMMIHGLRKTKISSRFPNDLL